MPLGTGIGITPNISGQMEYRGSFGEYLSLVGESAIRDSPTASMLRWAEVEYLRSRAGDELLSPEQAKEKYGIEVDEPINKSAAESMQGFRRDRERTQYRLSSMARPGWGIAGFGAGLIASMADPVNLATAFIPVGPVVQSSKLAATSIRSVGGAVAGAGVKSRALQRLAQGAAEGTVGFLATEPLVALAQYKTQEGYTSEQFFENLFLSAGLGAGLQASVGAVGDLLTGLPKSIEPDMQQILDDALKTGVAEAVASGTVTTPQFAMRAGMLEKVHDYMTRLADEGLDEDQIRVRLRETIGDQADNIPSRKDIETLIDQNRRAALESVRKAQAEASGRPESLRTRRMWDQNLAEKRLAEETMAGRKEPDLQDPEYLDELYQDQRAVLEALPEEFRADAEELLSEISSADTKFKALTQLATDEEAVGNWAACVLQTTTEAAT